MKISKIILVFFTLGILFTGSSAFIYIFASNTYLSSLAKTQVAAVGAEGAPNAPVLVGATGVSANQITVAWANSEGAIQETSFKLYRDGQYVATLPYIQDSDIWHEPSLYQDVGRAPDTAYTYYVTAVAADGAESAPSISVTARTKDASQTGLIPPKRRADWIPGVTVGVPGGIPNRTNIINTANAPYFVSGSAQSTTGSITKGTNTLTVSSIIDLQVGQTIVVKNANADINNESNISDLYTTIASISGNTVTLSDPARATATNTSVNHSDTSVVNRAITEAPAGSVVYVPAGTYPGGFYIARSDVTLRGAGMDQTIVGGVAVRGGGGDGFYRAATTPVTGGAAWGSRQITVADASIVPLNWMIQLSGDNDLTLPEYTPGGAYQNLRKQNFMVIGKSGNTLTLDSPILGYKFQNPVISVSQSFSSRLGIEDMTIAAGGAQVGFSFQSVYASWIKNVRIKEAGNYTISMADSHMSEIRHSYLDAQASENNSNHAGLLTGAVTGLLFEDNIVLRSFPLLEINGGSAGNVFAYNYLVGGVVDSNHGAHNSFNLYEGNIMDGIMSDGYFGSESEQTLYRNWITGKSFGIAIKRFSRNFNIIGNQIGTDGGARGIYSLGQPNIGNGGSTGWAAPSAGVYWREWGTVPAGWPPEAYQERDLDVPSSMILRANRYSGISGYLNGANEDLQSGEALTDSLFRSSKPGFFGNLSWPPFSPTSPNFSETAIPAGYRYKNGTEAPGVTGDTFNPPPLLTSYTLTVTKSGAGTGTVSGSTISCGSTCSGTFASGSSVALTATPATGSAFAGWGGACSGTGSCTVTVLSNTTVTASFTTVSNNPPVISGISASSLTQTGATISWTTDKAADTQIEYGLTTSYGNSTTLDATAVTSHSQTLSGLSANTTYNYRVKSKDSSGNLTTSANQTFKTSATAVTTYTLTVSRSGLGRVSAPGISCGSTCNTSVTAGSQITLSASPSSDYKFSNWGGVCSGSNDSCTITVNSNVNVQATFIANPSNVGNPGTDQNVSKPDPIGSVLKLYRDFGLGDTGNDIRELQKFLNAKGYRITSTGPGSIGQETTTFGSLTKAALARFQAANGISPTGYVGPLTRAKLSGGAVTTTTTSSSSKTTTTGTKATQPSSTTLYISVPKSLTSTLSLGSKGGEVVLLQQILSSIPGMYPEKKQSGTFDSATELAVQRFQAKYNLSKAGEVGYGVVGPTTRTKLNSFKK